MVALTQKYFFAHYAWFPRGESHIRTYIHSEPSRTPACRRFMNEGERTGEALPQAAAQLQILATPNDPEAPNKDGDKTN